MTTPTQLQFHQISHHTRLLATEQDEYNELYIRDETMDDGSNIMVSEWKPTDDQLATLKAGGSIYLGIIGEVHPPVLLLAGLQSIQHGGTDDGNTG